MNQALKLIMKMGVHWGSGFGSWGCERDRRIEVIVKIKKKQVWVDVNEEFKFLY